MRKMPNISSPYRSFNITFWKIVDFLSNFGVPWGRPPSLNRVDIGVKKVVHWPQKLNTENPEWIGPIATNWCVFLRKCVSLSTLEVSGGAPPWSIGLKMMPKVAYYPQKLNAKNPESIRQYAPVLRTFICKLSEEEKKNGHLKNQSMILIAWLKKVIWRTTQWAVILN